MLTPLCLGPLNDVKAACFVPASVKPLIAATKRGENVAPLILSVARSFGFDGFLYAASLSLRPHQETRQFVYSTWPEELSRLFDERGYIEVDPRFEDAVASVLPVVWEQATYRGRSKAIDDYLDVLKSYGIASGVLCPVRDVRGRIGAMTLSSHLPENDEVRTLMFERQMGELVLFGHYFHEMFVSGVLNELVPSHLTGKALTARELECLDMGARGMSGEDIAGRLDLSPRTIQHYFDSIRGKLGAANRLEAIARAQQMGLIGPVFA